MDTGCPRLTQMRVYDSADFFGGHTKYHLESDMGAGRLTQHKKKKRTRVFGVTLIYPKIHDKLIRLKWQIAPSHFLSLTNMWATLPYPSF